MNAWLVVAVLVMAGCAHSTEDGGDERAEQGQKNLAAIAVLQGARPLSPVLIVPAEPVGAGPAAEPDAMAIVPGVIEGLPRLSVPDMQVRVPWRPSPPTAPVPENWRVTPPYTVLTPAIPAYPGPGPRCRPDYFGGQRC